jgi:hypothetical protein
MFAVVGGAFVDPESSVTVGSTLRFADIASGCAGYALNLCTQKEEWEGDSGMAINRHEVSRRVITKFK